MILRCGWCECEFDSNDLTDDSKHKVSISSGATYIWCLK